MISKKKLLPVLAVVPLLGAAVVPAATDASVATKNVQIKYNNVKVMYNGVVVPTTVEPFIMDGTTYIPLRMMANVFSKDITWDGATYTIDVKDRPDPRDSRIQTLEAQLKTKDAEIARLKTELANANSKKSSSDDLDDLEDDLQEEFEDYFDDIELDISLDGDEDDIEVEIAVDVEEFEDEWEDLDESDIEDLVIDIIEYIWDEFDDEATVTGVIVDSSDDDEELYEFEGDPDDGDIYLDDDVIN